MTNAAITGRLSAEAREAIGAYLRKNDGAPLVLAVDAAQHIRGLFPELAISDATLMDSIAGTAIILDLDVALATQAQAVARLSFTRTSWLRRPRAARHEALQ